MTELPPPPEQSSPSAKVHHFTRMPTGGTRFTRDPALDDVDPVPSPPAVSPQHWFRRMPNGGTVRRSVEDVDRPPFDVGSRLLPPQRPNGGGTVYQLPNANEADPAAPSGGESASE